jgi:uncharacterized membrane protein YhaH (DUF805 family)
MGSFSLWHWLIVLVVVIVPLIFIFRAPPAWSNRFGSRGLPMSFVEAIASYFLNYVNFTGRASRSEYWFAVLFHLIVGVVLRILPGGLILTGIWSVVTLLPSLAMAVRRLHDVNRSGWHYLLVFCFPIGTIALIVWLCRRPRDAEGMALASVFA